MQEGFKYVTLIVGGFAAAVGFALYLPWSYLLNPVKASPQAPVPIKVPAPASSIELRTLEFKPDELLRRPLFSPTRRVPPSTRTEAPPPMVQPEALQPEPPPPEYLIGGILVSSSLGRALLRKQQQDAGDWISLGETTKEGWSVAEIKADEVILEKGGRRMAVQLRRTEGRNVSNRPLVFQAHTSSRRRFQR